MISEKELYEAIDSLETCSNPTYETVKRLADFYIVKNELYGGLEQKEKSVVAEETIIGDYGDSEFLMSVQGKNPEKVWSVIDRLMSTLKVVNEKLYNFALQELDMI